MTAEPHWQLFADPRFPFHFRYPNPTPQGFPIEVNEYTREDDIRIHLTSKGSKEVYFEVSRYPADSVQANYERLTAEVEERFDARVSPLIESTFAGQPAFEMTFQWDSGERFVTYVVKDEVLYRILCDPTSDLNLHIRSTVEFE